MNTCAFTGHRNVKEAHKRAMPDILERAIDYAYKKGCRRFIAGGAIGFDTAAARAVLHFRLRHPDVVLVLFIPCLDQDASWSARQRDSYDYILASADEVKYISESYDRDCMKRRNMAMAEECDIMIGYVSKDRSGAAQTYRMAVSLGKEAYNLYGELERING